MKNKFTTIAIIIGTILLAAVAIFTAIRLYQTRNVPVAPNVPSSEPEAYGGSCSVSFTITGPTTTPTGASTPPKSPTPTGASTPPTGSATATPTSTANPTGEPNSCNGTCGSNSNCNTDLFCYSGYCRNSSCPTESDCTCSGTAPTITPTSTSIAGVPTTTSEPALPDAGTSWPTIFGTAFGILVILGSLLLVF